jgi:hypothetical protein
MNYFARKLADSRTRRYRAANNPTILQAPIDAYDRAPHVGAPASIKDIPAYTYTYTYTCNACQKRRVDFTEFAKRNVHKRDPKRDHTSIDSPLELRHSRRRSSGCIEQCFLIGQFVQLNKNARRAWLVILVYEFVREFARLLKRRQCNS